MTINAQSFKEAMARFASGVTLVTTEYGGAYYGMTVAAFSSVSLDPPLVLVCISNAATSREPIAAAGKFAVHILGADQAAIGWKFAAKNTMLERFSGLEPGTAETGSPIVSGCLAFVDCLVAQAYVAGDHTIFVGEVVAAGVRDDTEALLHYRRTFRTVGCEPQLAT